MYNDFYVCTDMMKRGKKGGKRKVLSLRSTCTHLLHLYKHVGQHNEPVDDHSTGLQHCLETLYEAEVIVLTWQQPLPPPIVCPNLVAIHRLAPLHRYYTLKQYVQ